MNKISYPISIPDKSSFEDAYYMSLNNIDEAGINRHLANLNLNGVILNFKHESS